MSNFERVFEEATNILDVGGWFRPEPRATHVVDLMPWETRGVKLSLTAQPSERFSKATWFQADFLEPGLRLPFDDKSFDLVVCGHTLEDLANPRWLLGEMQRIGKRGIIECPSRLVEQTIGMRDRASALPGYSHHHWIVEFFEGELRFYSKEESRLQGGRKLLPLLFTEQRLRGKEEDSIVIHAWENEIGHRFFTGRECERRAEEFVTSMRVPFRIRKMDSALRFARRMRRRLRGLPAEDFSWWAKIVEASRPYSTIPLK